MYWRQRISHSYCWVTCKCTCILNKNPLTSANAWNVQMLLSAHMQRRLVPIYQMKRATTWDFQQCDMGNQQSVRSACAYAQPDQSLCLSLKYCMTVKLLTEHHLEFLSLKGGSTGSSEPTHVKMPHCWKSHVVAQMHSYSHVLINTFHEMELLLKSPIWKATFFLLQPVFCTEQ